MKSRLIIALLSGATVGLMTGCGNIERDSKDVSTNAATISADTLETLELSALDAEREAPAVVADTTPTVVSNNPTAEGMNDNGYTETEVVQIDTISTRIVYDIRRRTIEQVDTVGATKTYEIRKRILKRTVMLDTLTETEDREQTVAFQKGDFKVLDENVETDSAVEIVDYQQAKREAAQARAKAKSSERQNATAQEPESSESPQETSARKPASQEQPSESTTQQPTQPRNATAQEPTPTEEQPRESTSQRPTQRQNATAQEPDPSEEQPSESITRPNTTAQEPASSSEEPASTTQQQTPQSQSDDNSSASSPNTNEERTPTAPDETAKQDTTRSDSGI